MQPDDLKAGDVVQIRSGTGPLMTVGWIKKCVDPIDIGPAAYCQWFDEGDLREGMIPCAALQAASPAAALAP